MTGPASVVLRDRFDVARRLSEPHDTTTAISEVRRQVALALGIAWQQLEPIEEAAAAHDIAWLDGRFPNWNAERRLLRDEVQELKRLLDDVDLLLIASGYNVR